MLKTSTCTCCLVMSDSLPHHGLWHAWLPHPTLSLGVCSNTYPLNWWCHPTISSSVIPFSSWLQSCPASGSFPVSWLFTSGSQSIGASALASVLPKNIQGWFPLRLTALISLQPKGLSRVFCNIKVQSINFMALSFLYSPTHVHTWLLEKPSLWLDGPLSAKWWNHRIVLGVWFILLPISEMHLYYYMYQ